MRDLNKTLDFTFTWGSNSEFRIAASIMGCGGLLGEGSKNSRRLAERYRESMARIRRAQRGDRKSLSLSDGCFQCYPVDGSPMILVPLTAKVSTRAFA